MSHCVSDLALELFLLDELAVTADREHIIGCVRCRQQLATKRRVGATYMDSRAAKHVGQVLGAADRVAASERVRTRKLVLGVAVAAAAAVLAIALWPGGRTEAEAEVLAVERAWVNAIAKNDHVALDAILADDYESVDPSGRIRTKADDLARARSKVLRFDRYDTSNLHVRVWGDTAVVTGHGAIRGAHAGEAFASNIAFTDTLARIDGRWRAVSAHVSHR